MYALLRLAAAQGLRVEWSGGMGELLRGVYEDRTRTITLSTALTTAQARVTLAHELGHARYRHRRVGVPRIDAAAERLADEHAARLLIDPAAYAAAEALVGPHPGALARELGVTASLVATWQRLAHDAGLARRTGCVENADLAVSA